MRYYTKNLLVLFVGFTFVFLSGCSPLPSEEGEKDKGVVRVTQDDLKKESQSVQSVKNNQNTTTQENNSSKEILMNKKKYDNPPEMQINRESTYSAILKTDKGDIAIALFAQQTPKTVNNFVFLSREGFYDNTLFHRIIEGFMIQGGDPTGTGGGGPGYRFDDEEFSGEYSRGVVAMANAGPDTNGSQFFIMHKDNSLPPNYVIFGEVIEGLDIVDAIATSPVETNVSGEKSSPTEPTFIKRVVIEEE